MDDTVSTLTRIVREAGRIVSGADLPDPLRGHAFERALDVLLAEAALPGPRAAVPRSASPAPAVAGARERPDAAERHGGPEGSPSPLARIARRAGIGEREAKEVYRFDNDQLALVVGDKKLDRNKATGSRQITLLVAGGRQAAEFEEWTALSRTREICSFYNRLDSKNYAATVKSMADVFNFHGQGVQREVRLTMPGWDEWAALVRKLAAAGDLSGR